MKKYFKLENDKWLISNNDLNYVLGLHFRIPRLLRPKIIKEFISMGFISINDKRTYRINDKYNNSNLKIINFLLETTI